MKTKTNTKAGNIVDDAKQWLDDAAQGIKDLFYVHGTTIDKKVDV
jgi:hypothetical protein